MKWMNTAGNANRLASALRASNRSVIRRTTQCLALFSIAFSEFAFSATCTLNTPTGTAAPSLPQPISVSRDEIALGLKFPQSGEWYGYGGYVTTTPGCTYGEYVYTPVAKVVPNVTYKTSSGKVASVFETGIPGIGFTVEVWSQRSGTVAIIDGEVSSFTNQWITGDNLETRVTFVSTGPLMTGTYTITSVPIFKWRVRHRGVFLDGTGTAISLSPQAIRVTARACKVTSGATNSVMLPTLVAASLKAPGDVASARSAPFSIGLNCDANVNVHATLTDATNPANTGGTLSLAPSSTATGVGIQILKKGESTPLNFGPDSSAKGNTNQWTVGKSSSANTPISVPFEARYVKVAETIKPGSVAALSTITFSYQ